MKKIYLLFVMCFIGALTGVAQNVIRIIDGDSEKVYLASDLDSLTIRAIDYYSAEDPLPPGGDVEDDVNAEYVNRVVSNTGLTLMATQHFVEPGMAVKFAVLDENGNDVTADAKVYVIENNLHKHLSNKTYVCQEVGTYQFWAFYNDLETRHDVLLEVVSVTDKLDVLADANPTSTNFFHRALIIKATGVSCPNCPRATDGIHMFFDNSEYADNAALMALHTYASGDPLWSNAAETLKSQAGLGASYPAIKINFDKLIPTLSSAEIAASLNDAVSSICNKAAETAIAVSTAYDEATGLISVSAKVKCDNPNKYKVTAVLLQDNVYFPQDGASKEEHNIHGSGVKAVSPTTGVGFALNNGDNTKMGGVYDFCCEFNASELYAKGSGNYALDVLRDARILVYVQTSDRIVDNVVACGLNKQVGFEYNK